MRSVPAAFTTAIKEGTLKACELFSFTLKNGKTYYYCNHDDDIDWGTPSSRYYSAPIQRSVLSSSMNLEVDTTVLKLSGITQQLFDEANSTRLNDVYVVIKRIFWDQASGSGMEFTLFAGTGDVTFNRNELEVPLSSILNTLNIEVPRNNFQQPCNYTLFDSGCTLVQSSHKASSTTTSNGPNDYTVVDSAFTVPGGDLYKYNNGEIHITSGDNIGERRNILSAVDGLIVVTVPFPSIIVSGVTYDYYPGCDYTPETCRDRFSNEVNFYGFVYLPAAEESM